MDSIDNSTPSGENKQPLSPELDYGALEEQAFQRISKHFDTTTLTKQQLGEL